MYKFSSDGERRGYVGEYRMETISHVPRPSLRATIKVVGGRETFLTSRNGGRGKGELYLSLEKVDVPKRASHDLPGDARKSRCNKLSFPTFHTFLSLSSPPLSSANFFAYYLTPPPTLSLALLNSLVLRIPSKFWFQYVKIQRQRLVT